MGYEGIYLSRDELLDLLIKSWKYNHFKYDTGINNEQYYTDILKECDYDVLDHNHLYDLNRDKYFLKQRRGVKFKCKKCNRIIFYKFVNDLLNLQTATGVDNDGNFLTCDELIIKNIIE